MDATPARHDENEIDGVDAIEDLTETSVMTKRRIIRLLLVAGGIVAAIFAVFVVLLVSAFRGNAPLPETMDLPGGARLIKDGIVAFFVLPTGGTSVALVDCGNDPSAERILSELSRRGSTRDDVKAILLTHGHGDHTAGCHVFPKAEVMALEPDVALAAGKKASRGLLTRLQKNDSSRAVQVTRAVRDGETLELGDLSVRVYAIPGHTDGSAAYLAHGILYLGDSATCRADGSLTGAASVFSDDVDLNHASLRALYRRLQDERVTVEVLAAAHSAPQQGIGALAAFGKGQE